jgi:hypothetical protein
MSSINININININASDGNGIIVVDLAVDLVVVGFQVFSAKEVSTVGGCVRVRVRVSVSVSE